MDFWIDLWSYFFFASITIFLGLAIFVTIGGYRDIKSMFRKISTSSDGPNRTSENRHDK